MPLTNLRVGAIFKHNGTIYKLIKFEPGKGIVKAFLFWRAGSWQPYKGTITSEMTLLTEVKRVRINIREL